MNPRFEAGIPDFMNGILNCSIHFNVVHRKVDWRNPKMKSLNSMPDIHTVLSVCIHSIQVHYLNAGILDWTFLIRTLWGGGGGVVGRDAGSDGPAGYPVL